MSKQKPLTLQSISDYRTELMGIAILGILFYHMRFDINDSPYLVPFKLIKAIGYGGVDLFFLLSGFGITYGWLSKKYSISEFYKKRLARIIPTYWLWMLIYGFLQIAIFKDFKFKGFIADFFGIGFLSSRSYNNWFVPSIIICYLIFPLIMSVLVKERSLEYRLSKNLIPMLVYSSFPALGISLILILVNANQLLIFSSRLPNFILGILIGLACFKYKATTLKDLRTNIFFLVILIFLGLFALYLANTVSTDAANYRYGFWWYPFIIITFPLCFLLANGIAWIETRFSRNAVFLSIRSLLIFCGAYSLEIYLMHGLLFSLFSVHQSHFSNTLMDSNDVKAFSYFLLAAISIVSAYSLGQTVRYVDYLVKKYVLHI